MKFLDQLDQENQMTLEREANQITLDPGQYLLRRGEPGGDIYLLKTGTLEVVDTRTTPEVILAYLEPGDVVGEMAFMDDSPRSADVRASGVAQVFHWPRDDLHRLLKQHAVLSAQFYQSVAKMAATRLRQLASTTVSGVISRRERSNTAGTSRVREDTMRLAEEIKSALLEIDTRLRLEPAEKTAREQMRSLLNRLQARLNELFSTYTDSTEGNLIAETLTRELHPYLVRSSLAERCTRMTQGMQNPAEILAHVYVNNAGGDGQLGEIIDRWLLDRPTLKAIRALQRPTVDLVANVLPTHRNRRVLLVNAGTGSLVAALNHHMGSAPTVLTVVDQQRDALACLDMGVTSRPRQVELQKVHENLAQFAMGRSRHSFPKQDVVVMPGLLEYMPDRIALSALDVARDLLVQDGTVIISALQHSDDQNLLDRLLNWPSIRRTPARLSRLLDRAGFSGIQIEEIQPPAILAFAQAPSGLSRQRPVSLLQTQPVLD